MTTNKKAAVKGRATASMETILIPAGIREIKNISFGYEYVRSGAESSITIRLVAIANR